MADPDTSPQPVRIPDHLQVTPVTARGLRPNRFVRVVPVEEQDSSPYEPNARQPSVGLRSTESSPRDVRFVRSPSSVLDSGRLRVAEQQVGHIEVDGVRARLAPGFQFFVEDNVAYLSRLHYISRVESGMLPVSTLFDAVQVLRAIESEMTGLSETMLTLPFARTMDSVTADNPARASNERATFEMIRREVGVCERALVRYVEQMHTAKDMAYSLGYCVDIE